MRQAPTGEGTECGTWLQIVAVQHEELKNNSNYWARPFLQMEKDRQNHT
jgi:hypothetical protein